MLRFFGCISVALLWLACNTAGDPLPVNAIHREAMSDAPNTIPAKSKAADLSQLSSYVIFGMHCGMCYRNCTKMFLVDTVKDVVFADYSGSYFHTRNLSSFVGNGMAGYEFEQAAELLSHLPSQLLSLKEEETRFGCPDCADQCLLYIEIRDGMKSSQAYIDTDHKQLPPYLIDFAKKIRETINRISS